jgi:hypothetical protein
MEILCTVVVSTGTAGRLMPFLACAVSLLLQPAMELDRNSRSIAEHTVSLWLNTRWALIFMITFQISILLREPRLLLAKRIMILRPSRLSVFRKVLAVFDVKPREITLIGGGGPPRAAPLITRRCGSLQLKFGQMTNDPSILCFFIRHS